MGNIGARGKVKNQGELGFSRKIVFALQGSHRRETPDRPMKDWRQASKPGNAGNAGRRKRKCFEIVMDGRVD
jgi:hypothetical protein